MAVYTAKKHAEGTPGVGADTDLNIITKDGWMPVVAEIRKQLDIAYNSYTTKRKFLETRHSETFWKRIDALKASSPDLFGIAMLPPT